MKTLNFLPLLALIASLLVPATAQADSDNRRRGHDWDKKRVKYVDRTRTVVRRPVVYSRPYYRPYYQPYRTYAYPYYSTPYYGDGVTFSFGF